MAEYIEREAAKESFLNMDAGSRAPCSTLLTPEEFAEYLDEIPTADVASVVRCKDCEYSNKALYGWLWCTAGPCGGKAVLEDFYCKCGERRTGNGKAVDEG